ncbi:hypothetical protein [Methanoculleus taiwanensis]|uniref:hypothetical protein n=1 Tax=Methanoculleus taiwanensis TaxID=1550565 RepID=UPI001F4FBD32|nr:hypothetical protein [Methanoculleus taiwanensis]
MTEARRYELDTHARVAASTVNSDPMAGRARLIADPVNGFRNVAAVTRIRISLREYDGAVD